MTVNPFHLAQNSLPLDKPTGIVEWYEWWALVLFVGHVIIQLTLALRVIMRRRSVGESLAWIMVIFVFPVVGPLGYLLFGELRLGRRRAQRYESLFEPIRQWLKTLPKRHQVDWAQTQGDCEPLANLAERSLQTPALRGNDVELIDEWNDVFSRMIADIDAAQRTCHLEEVGQMKSQKHSFVQRLGVCAVACCSMRWVVVHS